MCEDCTNIANKPVDERLSYMLLQGLAGECSLAKERMAWLMMQEMRGKAYAPVMPDDPEPQFWPSHARRKVSNGTLSLIDRIKQSYRIEDIVAPYVNLRGTHTLSGPCPLHAGSGSEFVVWVDEAKWRCFGRCGIGGDVIDLVREMKARGIEWMKS